MSPLWKSDFKLVFYLLALTCLLAPAASASEVIFTISNGNDVKDPVSAQVISPNVEHLECINNGNSTASEAGCTFGPRIGSYAIAIHLPKGSQAIVTGTFNDNTTQVLLQATV